MLTIAINKNRLIKREEILEELFPLENSFTDYITKNGDVYKDYGNDMFLKKSSYINKHNGYVYANITHKDGGNRNVRVHRLIAQTFIPNPNNYDIVGHKNNIKHDNRIENLYWTTISENTQKAVDDGLMKNDIGVEDSQSCIIACYTNDGELVSVYGSIIDASRHIEGFTKSSIHKSVVNKSKKGRKGYIFREITKEEYLNTPEDKKNVRFQVKYYTKYKRTFEAISSSGERIICDNQKQFCNTYNLKQGLLSQRLRKPEGGKIGEWYVRTIKKEIL